METKGPEALNLVLRLLENCRNELMGIFPHLDGVFPLLEESPVVDGATIATDGALLYLSPRWLIGGYSLAPERLRRGYLHMLLHCLYLHPFRDNPDPLWHIACDMAVEQLICRENHPRLMLVFNPVREACIKELGGEICSAESLWQRLRQGEFPYTRQELADAFSFDDHRLWGHQQDKKELEHRWRTAGAGAAQKRRGRPGTMAGADSFEAYDLRPSDRDYRRYLRRFTHIREEMELDTEHFDPVFYHFGLDHYGNMPLIEPLECKEVARLEELVIAIDTSGSCSRETVMAFLEDTYAIVSARENFFQRMKVYLIQCDCMIQDVQILRSPEDWHRCCRNITIQGRGGTDFTPVFTYVDKLIRERELKDLKALLYFTDGEGVYPREQPTYETAFVFSKDTEYMNYAPVWVKKLRMGGRAI